MLAGQGISRRGEHVSGRLETLSLPLKLQSTADSPSHIWEESLSDVDHPPSLSHKYSGLD